MGRRIITGAAALLAIGATFFSAIGIGPAKAATTAAEAIATKQNLVKDSFMRAEFGDSLGGRQ